MPTLPGWVLSWDLGSITGSLLEPIRPSKDATVHVSSFPPFFLSGTGTCYDSSVPPRSGLSTL